MSSAKSPPFPRPAVPPKPDKASLKLHGESPGGSVSQPNSPEIRQVSANGEVSSEASPESKGVSKSHSASAVLTSSFTFQAHPPPTQQPPPNPKPLIQKPPISPAKPALPPKPNSSAITPPKKALSSPPTSSPGVQHSPSIHLPTGRNSLSIANTILANKGRLSLSPHSGTSNSTATTANPPKSGPSSLPTVPSKSISSGNVGKVPEDSFSDPETSTRVIRREKSEGFSSPPLSRPPSSSNPFNRPNNKFLLSSEPVGVSRPQSFASVSSRPTSSVFTFPPYPEADNKPPSFPPAPPVAPPGSSFTRRLELKGKSASLGRNVAPPSTSTSITAGISGFFTNKAVTLSRILPLDLHFGKSSSKQEQRPSSLPPLINFHHSSMQSQMNNPKSPIESFGRNIFFSTGNGSNPPPPPPPRLKKKLSPVNSLSPVESSSPSSPAFSPLSPTVSSAPSALMSPVSEEPSAIYAEIDKEKKWADRRLKEEANNQSREPSLMGDSDGIQASLVININRNLDNKVESVSVDGQSQTFCVEKSPPPPNSKPPAPSSSVKQLSSQFESQSNNNNTSANKSSLSGEEPPVDSWLAKYIPTSSNQPPPSTPPAEPKDSLNNICETMKSIVLTDLSQITGNGKVTASELSLNESEVETNDEPQSITLTLGPPQSSTSTDIHFLSTSVNNTVSSSTIKQEETTCVLAQNESFLFAHLKPQPTETSEKTTSKDTTEGEASQKAAAAVEEQCKNVANDDANDSNTIQSSVTITHEYKSATSSTAVDNNNTMQVRPVEMESQIANETVANSKDIKLLPKDSVGGGEVPDQDVLLHLVGANIQSVVTHLSNLSGKVGNSDSSCLNNNANDDLTSQSFTLSSSPPPVFNESLVPLSITEFSDALANSNKLQQTQEQHHDTLKDNCSSLSAQLSVDPHHPGGDEVKASSSYTQLPTVIEDTDKDPKDPFPRRRSWNCSGDSSSPCDSTSSLNNIRERASTNPGGKGKKKWVDEGDISTGALADTENSDVQVPGSSTEDIGASGSLSRRKRLWIFSSFGKPGSSSSSSSNGGTHKNSAKGRHKDKSRSMLVDSNGRSSGLTTGRLGRQISDSVLGTSLISNPLGTPSPSHSHSQQELPVREMPSKDSPKSHPTVQFSPDVVDTPVYRYRYSESSVSDAGDVLGTSICPEGDNESVSSAESSTGGVTAGSYVVTVPEYEDILNDLTSQKERKAFYVAREILSSEKNFLSVLDLLTIDFPNAIKKVEKEVKHPIIPPFELDGILASLPNLKLVNEELKDDLENRIKNWRQNPKLADVIVKKGPFLKLYAHYIKNFEKTTQILDACCHRYPSFQKAVSDFEASDRCQKLGLKHYMLKPVQRMPQYRLLLEDYIKALEPGSGDYNDTVKALGIVKDVAEHANEAIRLQVNAEKLMHLQNRLAGSVIMKSDRQLMKEGELRKVCRKGLQPRYFALMNDCLLCMNYNVGTGAVKDLKLRYELPLTGMKVSLTATEDYPNEFSVVSIARSFNLVAISAKERETWMKALNDCINDNIKKRACSTPDKELGFQLGKIAPVWIQDSRVTMCQICTAEFTVTFRRHHCRACGKVVCGHCSGNSAPLQYLKNDAARVCDECYQHLLDEFDKEAMESNSADGLETSLETIRNRFKKVTPNVSKRATHVKRIVPARLEVHANNSGAKVSSYLYYRKRKAWKRNWFVLIDRVLYVYAASEDIVATRTIPVLGWMVAAEQVECMDGGDNEAVFKLMHSGQNTLLFQAENPALAERWIEALKEATVLT